MLIWYLCSVFWRHFHWLSGSVLFFSCQVYKSLNFCFESTHILVYRSDPSKTLFEQSFFGQLYHNKKVIYSDQKDATKNAFKQLVPALKSFNVWQFSIYYTGRLKFILLVFIWRCDTQNFWRLNNLHGHFWNFRVKKCVILLSPILVVSCRVKSIQGWIFPWLDWTYANATDTSIVSNQLDVYGYTYFMSPIVALFPGFLSYFVLKFKKNEYYANLYTSKPTVFKSWFYNTFQVGTLMIITSIIGGIISFQMTLQVLVV